MMRYGLLSFAIFGSLAVFGQTPERDEQLKPISEPANQKKTPACPCAAPTLDGSCICPIYPVWWDGQVPGTYLYYSEICDSGPSCPVVDVGYRVDGPLAWPLECSATDCGECLTVGGLASAKFSGLAQPFPSRTTAKQMLPTKSYNGGNTSFPQKGVKQSTEFYVRFKDDISHRTIYAKLIVASMKSKDAQAPRDVVVRPLLIGYEIEADDDLPADELITEPRVKADKGGAFFKRVGNQRAEDVSWVRKVTLDNRLHFLVLLANPNNGGTPTLESK